jgi:CRP-like cAMP-binding protein
MHESPITQRSIIGWDQAQILSSEYNQKFLQISSGVWPMNPTLRNSHSTENQILASLNKTEHQNFLSQLEPVSVIRGQVLYEAEALIDHVYFPQTAVFSMLATMESGETVEVGPVGREGLVGLRIFLGAKTTPDRVIVHMSGSAMRLSSNALKTELGTFKSALSRKLLRYTQMLLVMTGRTGACNKVHSIEQQLARWLLTMNDYVDDHLRLTHELIALTLGVRRASISVAASMFKDAGLIDYHRGDIQLLDRKGLESIACECYVIIKDEYDRLYVDLSQ